MKKKGFTLIELLAVILILAIIAVIVTPIISKIIDEAKTQADKRSAEKFVRAGQVFYTEAQVDEAKGNMLGTNVINQLDLENTDAEGAVVVNTDGSIEMAIVIGKKCYTKTATQDIKDIVVSKDIENCTVLSTSVAISTIESKTDSIVITVDPGDTGITMTSCKFGRTRGDYTNDGVIEGNTCTLTPCETGKKYYYEITFSDGSKRSGGMQAGTGEISRPNNGGGSSSGGVSGGGSGSGGSSSGGGVAAPVLVGEQGQTIYNGRYLATVKTIYFNVTTGEKCTNSEWTSNGGSSTNGMKSGCLRFWGYMEDNLSYTAILDRNTDNSSVAYASSNNNSSGPVTALAKLKTDTDSWLGTITPSNYTYYYKTSGMNESSYVIPYDTDGYKARFITSREVAGIVGKTDFDPYSSNSDQWFYLDGGTSEATGATWQTQIATSSEKSAYAWLFNYMNGCGTYGCYDSGSKYGYWTSDNIAYGGTENAWTVDYIGAMRVQWNYPRIPYASTSISNDSNYGIRPVVTILKSSLQ